MSNLQNDMIKENLLEEVESMTVMEFQDALDKAGLPSTYGSDDIPLIIQDKVFTNNLMDFSDLGGRFLGDTFLVNGIINPNLQVEKGIYRFRLLNASNARFYNFYIENSSGLKNTYQHIATDGGFINAPVSTTLAVWFGI